MPLNDKLVHRLAIVAPTVTTELDDYRQPVAGASVTTLASGFLYPRKAEEQAQANEAGALVADHDVIFPLRSIPDAGYIRFDPDTGDRYEIQGHEPYGFGMDQLVVVHTRRVVTDSPDVVSA